MQERKPKSLEGISPSQHTPQPGTKEGELTRVLECPTELGPIARQEWGRVVGQLTLLGILSAFDRAPLAAYCNAYSLWIEAVEMVQKYGATIQSPNGHPVQSPYLTTVNRQADMMMKIACQFGFTPASRSRIFSYSKNKSMLLEIVEDSDDGLTKW
jgi:P27 family predicted phage terminase small subunit